MPPRKKTTRRERFSPRVSERARHLAGLSRRDPDEDEAEAEWDDADDFEDLDDLEKLLDDLEASRRSSRGRAVQVARRPAAPGPLARAWLDRVGHCGAGEARRKGGEEALRAGALVNLYVQRGRLQAEVAGSRRYRVAVDFLPPSLSLTAAVMARVGEARAALPPGDRQREALQEAILAAGPAIFPSPVQMAPTCTCPEGKDCKHVVVAVHGFGAALDREPELLFTLWGLAEPGPRRAQALIVAPLPPERPLLTGDLGALFGIDLLDASPAPARPPAPVPAPTPAPEVAPAPAPAPEAAPAAKRGRGAKRGAGRGQGAQAEPTLALEFAPASTAPAAPTPPPRRVPPCELPEASREYLRVLGLSNRQIDAWIRQGVLGRTDRRDVFRRTPEANRLIAEFLAV